MGNGRSGVPEMSFRSIPDTVAPKLNFCSLVLMNGSTRKDGSGVNAAGDIVALLIRYSAFVKSYTSSPSLPALIALFTDGRKIFIISELLHNGFDVICGCPC